jgi:hypothetical protein
VQQQYQRRTALAGCEGIEGKAGLNRDLFERGHAAILGVPIRSVHHGNEVLIFGVSGKTPSRWPAAFGCAMLKTSDALMQ